MTWMQTGTGRVLDLMAPRPEDIDLDDVAEALAREPRFGGHVRSGPYSVAQHCCLGVDCIEAAGLPADLARAFLLHDAHEAYCKDIPSPLAEALAARVARAVRVTHIDTYADTVFPAVLRGLKTDLDAAIAARVGMEWPPATEIAEQVKAWDLAMLGAERKQLLGRSPQPWAESIERAIPAPLRSKITVWPWPRAADEWRTRLHRLFPHLKPAA